MRIAEAIVLNEDERGVLQTWVHRGHAAARIQTRARILLKLAEGWRDVEIAHALEVGLGTVSNTRKRFLAGGLEAVLHDQAQARHRQALSGEQIAHLIAVACSSAPKGHDHWTRRLLAGQAVELGLVTGISPQTIRHVLKKTNASPGNMSSGVCRPSGRLSSRRWKRSSTSMRSRRTRNTR